MQPHSSVSHAEVNRHKENLRQAKADGHTLLHIFFVPNHTRHHHTKAHAAQYFSTFSFQNAWYFKKYFIYLQPECKSNIIYTNEKVIS